LSPRIWKLRGEGAFKYLELAAEARKRGLDEGLTGYGPSGGLPELREAVAEWLNAEYKTDVRPEEVIITAGAKAAIFAALMTVIEEGDEVIIPDPCYPAYESIVRFLGGVPRPVALREEREWMLAANDLEDAIASRTKAVILNYPHNPTGSTISPHEIREILGLAKERGLIVISDEIYDHYLYEGEHMPAIADNEWREFVIYINGFSKTFSMTGWRLGFAVADRHVIERMEVAANNMYSCPATFAQVAAKRALEEGLEWFEKYFEEYKRRRDVLVKELRHVPGVDVVEPRGTFYVFPSVRELLRLTGYSSVEKFAADLLFDTGVLLLPGTAFPFEVGRGHLRLSFTVPCERIREGIKSLRDWTYEKIA